MERSTFMVSHKPGSHVYSAVRWSSKPLEHLWVRQETSSSDEEMLVQDWNPTLTYSRDILENLLFRLNNVHVENIQIEASAHLWNSLDVWFDEYVEPDRKVRMVKERGANEKGFFLVSVKNPFTVVKELTLKDGGEKVSVRSLIGSTQNVAFLLAAFLSGRLPEDGKLTLREYRMKAVDSTLLARMERRLKEVEFNYSQHKRLWGWLSENVEKQTQHFSEWYLKKDRPNPRGFSPACQYVYELVGEDNAKAFRACFLCPLKWLEVQTEGENEEGVKRASPIPEAPCFFATQKWRLATTEYERKMWAKYISELPLLYEAKTC